MKKKDFEFLTQVRSVVLLLPNICWDHKLDTSTCTMVKRIAKILNAAPRTGISRSIGRHPRCVRESAKSWLPLNHEDPGRKVRSLENDEKNHISHKWRTFTTTWRCGIAMWEVFKVESNKPLSQGDPLYKNL